MTTPASGRKLTSACDGVSRTFTNPKLLASGDLKVYLLDSASAANSAGTLLSEGADYALAADLSTITTTAAYALGKYIRRWRSTSRKQGVEIVANVGVPAATQEGALDRLSLVDEEQDDDLSRSLLAPEGVVAPTLPLAADLAGKFLVGSADGLSLVPSVGTGADVGLRADLAATTGSLLIQHKSALASTYARTLRQWAAVGGMDAGNIFNWIDPALDATILDRSNAVSLLAFFQNAAAARIGANLRFPSASYLIDTSAGAIALSEIDLLGTNVLDGTPGTLDAGSMLLVKNVAHSPFTFGRGVSVQGLGIYYPDQVDSAAPIAFPPTFLADFSAGPVQFVNFHRNVVYNAFKFIEINDVAGNIGHVEILRNYICALSRAIYLRRNVEHFRVEGNNFTFGHWTSATEAGAAGYMRANAIAVQIDQSDGVEVMNNLVFGHLTGILTSALGLCQLMNVVNNEFDQVRYGIRAAGVGNFNGKITENTFNSFNSQNTALQGRSISIETSGNLALENINITANNFNLATEEHLYITGDVPTRDILVGVNSWVSWAGFKGAGIYGAINCNGASTNLQVTGGKMSSSNAAHCKGIVGTFNTGQVTGTEYDQTVAPIDVNVSIFTSEGNRSYNTSATFSDNVVANDYANGRNAWDKPSSKTKAVAATPYTVENRYDSLVVNVAGVCTLTLPSAAGYNGPGLRISTITANTVVSASANVVPLAGGAASTAILAAVAGKYAMLVPNGANWQIMAAN